MTNTHTSQPTAPRRQIRPFAQTDFAELVGVAKSSISRAAKGALAPAMLSSGEIDANHPLAVRYFANHCAPAAFVVFQDTFAAIAGCSISEVKSGIARGGSLVPALTIGDYTIRVTHPAALDFLRRHPFEIDDKYFPTNVPAILQTTEREDREWTDTHPLSQAYGAREDGAIDLRNSKASK